MSAPPIFSQPQGPVPEDRSHENYTASTVEPSTVPSPPMYMSTSPPDQTQYYNFAVQEPPSYISPKEADEAAITKKKRKICGIRRGLVVGLVIFIIAGVIAGAVYGIEQKLQPPTGL